MKRIQIKRTKGWRMPANAVYVGRPTHWGNPYAPGMVLGDVPAIYVNQCHFQHFSAEQKLTREMSMKLYEAWITTTMPQETIQHELGGKDLACWCPLYCFCHADVLLHLANNDATTAGRKLR